MKDYWLELSNREKQNERLRYNKIMDTIDTGESGEDSKISALEARVKALEDKNGYTVVVTEKNGVTGATVKLNNTTLTDNNDGTYSADNIVPDTYTLSIVKSDYTSISKSITVDSEHLTFEETLNKAPHTVSGTVKDDAGEPVALEGATVNILDDDEVIGTDTTNASGEYSIENIVSGTYSIQAVLTGYSHTAESITVNADDLTKNITMTTN